MRRVCFFLFVLLSLSTRSYGQWTQLFKFPDGVRTIFFLDQLGHSETGFAGLNDGELWKTPDSGKSWTKVFTDPEKVSISDITFKSLSEGWFATKPLAGQSLKTSIYMTTDGGSTWNLELFDFGSISAIYYHDPQKILLLSVWERGGFSSTDDGVSWNGYSSDPIPNGYAFSGANEGVVSFAKFSQSLLYNTSDGGISWQRLTISPSACWQPASKTGTSTFFMFSEYTTTLTRSDDNGLTWIPIKALPIPPGGKDGLSVSGCLRITECNTFFIQSTSLGFYTSTDEGLNWQAIGGPSNEADTRFCASAAKVYGADFNGGLWVFQIIPPPKSVLLQLNIEPSGKEPFIQPGKNIILDLSVSDTVRGLDSLLFDLHMGSTFLRFDSANTILGWRISIMQAQNGLWNCRLYNESRSDVITDKPVASFYFSSYLTTDSVARVFVKGTGLFLDPVRMNRCVALQLLNINNLALDDSVTIHAADTCGDISVRRFLSGEPLIHLLSIKPNPAGNEINFELNSISPCSADLMVIDEFGRVCRQISLSLEGKKILPVSLEGLPSGEYHVLVRSESGSISAPFIKLN